MIVLEEVSTSYGEFRLSIDLHVPAGSIASILGPSGSGKTSVLRLIAGFETPAKGRILVNQIDVTTMPASERRIGFVFQDYTLFPHMNVAGNVGYGMRVAKKTSGEIRRKTDELLDLVDLAGFGSRDVATLSGGERQRVAIARALAVDPLVLLLDEPFSAIDEVLRRDLRREILTLHDRLGITILFVTHSRREALSVSDHVAVMRDGSLVQFGAPMEIYRNPTDSFVASFAGETVRLAGSDTILRPEQIQIVESAADDRDLLAGTVAIREFLGFSWLYTVDTDRGDVSVYDSAELTVGSRVFLRLPGGVPD